MSLHVRFRVEANNQLFQSSFGLEIPLNITVTYLQLPLTPSPLVIFVEGVQVRIQVTHPLHPPPRGSNVSRHDPNLTFLSEEVAISRERITS